jgi:hypothetical protein
VDDPTWDLAQPARKGLPAMLAMGLLTDETLRLIEQAKALLTRAASSVNAEPHLPQFSIILAYAASDLQTELAIGALITWRQIEYLRDALQKTERGNLYDDRVKAVWAGLSGDRPWSKPKDDGEPPQAPWWPKWVQSYELRCAVAHKGRAGHA